MASEPRILVTGASGFIGARLVSWLTGRGRSVRGAVRTARAGDALRRVASEVVVVGDIGHNTEWSHALNGIDTVIHLAGRAHVIRDRSTDPLAEFREVNVRGTLRLAEQAASNVRRFVYLSSIGVHGTRTADAPFSGSSPVAPTESYAISKYEAEQALWSVAGSNKLEVVVVRPPLVYGPNCPGNFRRLLRLADSGIPLPFASIRNARSFIYVDNLVSALEMCAEQSRARGRTYLVDDGLAVSTPDLVRALAALLRRKTVLFPCPVPILSLIGRATGQSAAMSRLTDSLQIDGSAIRTELGWRPVCPMSEGLKQTVHWYRTLTVWPSASDRYDG